MSSLSHAEKRISAHARRAWIVIGILFFSIIFFAIFCVVELCPRLHNLVLQRTEATLRTHFQSRVEFSNYDISLFPQIRLTITGLVLRYRGRTDIPPLVQVNKITVSGTLRGFLRAQPRVSLVELDGLQIHTPPRHLGDTPWIQGTDQNLAAKYPALIEEVRADNALIVIFQDHPYRPPSELPIHSLRLFNLSFERPAEFDAILKNAVPPGDIDATGQFGPWVPDKPADTPAVGQYTFKNADLATLKGLSGTLSSSGTFSGPLNYLAVKGVTDTPDFALRTSVHPMALHTDFSAIVDGTNGDTYLKSVTARFLHTTLLVTGEIVDLDRAVKSRTIELNAVSRDARAEDLIRLGVKSDEPIMTGSVKLQTHIDIPESNADLIDRLKLKGNFAIDDGQFTNPDTQDKVDVLSRKGRGEPNDFGISDVSSRMVGNFQVENAEIDFSHLSFGVNGAKVDLSGVYNLNSGLLDFHGKLLLKAKLSQTTTGAKSFFLKALNPFFEGGTTGTVLPIKITGSSDNPKFALDRRHDSTKNDSPIPPKGE